MPKRTVKVGLAAYVDEDGLNRWGWEGEEVNVHPDHVERFDEFSGGGADESEPAPRRTRSRKQT